MGLIVVVLVVVVVGLGGLELVVGWMRRCITSLARRGRARLSAMIMVGLAWSGLSGGSQVWAW